MATICDMGLFVEGPHPAAVTKRAERANGGARAACFEQPEDVYSGCGDARPAKHTTCMASVFSVKGTVFGDGTVHDVLLAQFRAIHRPVDTLLQICVAIPRLSGAGIFKAPARATLSTSICRGTSTARFARTSVSPYGGWHNAYKCAVDVLPSLEQ